MGKLAQLKEEDWAKNIDFDKLGRGCSGQISVSLDVIESSWFSSQIEKVIDGAKRKLSPE